MSKLGAKWVHVLTSIDPEAKTAVCRGCGPVAIVYRKNRGWKCGKAVSSIVANALAKRVEARSHRPIAQKPPAPARPAKPVVPVVARIAPVAPAPKPSVVVISGPIVTGSKVRMSKMLPEWYRDKDGHVRRFWGAIGEVVGHSDRYPACWLVRWPEGDEQHLYPYAERFLELVSSD